MEESAEEALEAVSERESSISWTREERFGRRVEDMMVLSEAMGSERQVERVVKNVEREEESGEARMVSGMEFRSFIRDWTLFSVLPFKGRGGRVVLVSVFVSVLVLVLEWGALVL